MEDDEDEEGLPKEQILGEKKDTCGYRSLFSFAQRNNHRIKLD